MRAMTIAGAGEPICVTAAAYGSEVRHSLDRLGLRGRLLLEPEPRNTAPALCAAALVAKRADPQAIIVALPADHVIEDGGAFAASIARAIAAADRGWLTILGVKPRHASSALGYIMPAAAIDGLPQVHRVGRFIEKPQREIAESLVAAGALWNAGIVVARADTVIDAMRENEPAVLEAVERSLQTGGNKADDVQLNAREFAAAPSISFDKAVLERHEAVAVVALDAVWRDVGTWAEVAELYPADGDGNRDMGGVHLVSSRDTFVFSPHRLTVGIGLTDLVVVDTPDALLIAKRDELGRLRGVVEDAMAAGSFPEIGAAKQQFNGKMIKLRASEISIRQPHVDYARYWIVLQGSVRLTVKGQSSIHGRNESFHVPSGVFHTLGNMDSELATLIEIQVVAECSPRSLVELSEWRTALLKSRNRLHW